MIDLCQSHDVFGLDCVRPADHGGDHAHEYVRWSDENSAENNPEYAARVRELYRQI